MSELTERRQDRTERLAPKVVKKAGPAGLPGESERGLRQHQALTSMMLSWEGR